MRLYVFFAVAFVVVVFILQYPVVGAAAYSIINIVRPEMLFWGGNAASKVHLIFFGAAFISSLVNFKKQSFPHTENSLFSRELLIWGYLYFAFFILMKISVYDVSGSYFYVHELGKNILFCFVVFISLRKSDHVIRYQICLSAAFVFLGLWGIEQHTLGNVRLEGLGGSSWGDSNGVAAMFVLFFPVIFSFSDKIHANKTRLFAALGILVFLLLIFYTGSRGGFLGLVFASFFIWLKWKRKLMLAFVFMFLGLALLPFIDQRYIDRLGTIFDSTSSRGEQGDASVNSRLVFWKSGLMIFRDNPLTGVGFGAYPVAKLQYRDHFSYLEERYQNEFFRTRDPYVTHSTYIQVLSEGGLVVFIPFMLVIVSTFLSNRRLRIKIPESESNRKLYRLLAGIEAGIAGYCVCIVFINSILFLFFPLQLVVSSKIRKIIEQEYQREMKSKKASGLY